MVLNKIEGDLTVPFFDGKLKHKTISPWQYRLLL